MNQAARKKSILLLHCHNFPPLLILSLSPLSPYLSAAALAAAAVGRGRELEGREKIKIPSFHSCRPQVCVPYPGSLLLVKSPALSSVPEWQGRRSLALSLLAALEKRERERDRERNAQCQRADSPSPLDGPHRATLPALPSSALL